MTQHTAATTRGRRCRAIVIGADDAAVRDWCGDEELQTAKRIHVPDVFCAIGELTAASAREPIEIIYFVESEHMASASQQASALRRLDPSVRIILLSRQVLSGPAPTGFDDILKAADPEPQLKSGDNGLKSADASDVASPDDATGDDAKGLNDRLQIELASPHKQSQSNLLGDVDLVQAMLTSPASVHETALLLIRQHTGWSDLALHQDERDDASSAPVTYEDQHYGVLCSAHSDKQQLEQWASWLARWLALDRSYQQHRYMAYHDDLTDAWNRRYFDQFLSECMETAAKRRRPVTVMVLDIDDFKLYNDNFGHAAGDEILRETVRLLTSVIRRGDRVCRIGGDEFAVIFADPEGPREAGSHHPENVEQIANRFQEQICKMKFPKLGAEAPATLSVSAGLATYPWDGATPAALLERADQLALESKRRGKNAITLGPGARQICRKATPADEDQRG